MNEWTRAKRVSIVEYRDYNPGEPLDGISLSDQDAPELGGKIFRNPNNHKDQWYVNPAYFAAQTFESID